MTKAKYIRTASNQIIVFSELFDHSDFKRFDPISAGFITFGVNRNGDITCGCHGKSVTLNMDSNPDEDSALAQRQLAPH